MKSFKRLFIGVVILLAVVFVAANVLLRQSTTTAQRQHCVDASRAALVIQQNGLDGVKLEDYPTLNSISLIESEDDLLGKNSDYLILNVDGVLYRFDYHALTDNDEIILIVNVVLFVISILVLGLLMYINTVILKPFYTMCDVPLALSKGNLTSPIKVNRKGYFGKFVWGINMLRDSISDQKKKELSLQAEKKKLILSISHDIKIPLSAIKLYSKALEKGIYGEEKRIELAQKIDAKADEITEFVSRIVKASNEDFLALEVKNEEFYLHTLLSRINNYYSEKLTLLNIHFSIGKCSDCLLKGDLDRAEEVLQNIIENAIKYGDGKDISIRVDNQDNCRLITVENTGCTLPSEELPHLFDSFWRGSNAQKEEGSGLGLYICRTLMLKMGGDIFAQSQNGKMAITVVLYCA